MEIQEQSELRKILGDVNIPRMFRVRQKFLRDSIPDVPGTLRRKLEESGMSHRIRPGMRVVLTGSSRQIDHMPKVLRELVSWLKELGAEPYIIPAMGSHGGATDEGQKQLLESYGITEEFCGCPIHSSMETVQVGHLEDGDQVRMDKFAHEADAIILVGRIKAHTAFRGTYESGLVKMAAIGLGKREGADSLHKHGFGKLAQRLLPSARIVMENSNVVFGVGLLENEFDETCRIEILPGEEIFDREPGLLNYAKTRLPRILFPETDVLIVREIGKNFSGSGMDPNVTGTFGTPFAAGGIQKQRVAVLDITPESHGNYIGLGMADVSTRRAFEKLQTNATYLNMLTSTVLGVGKIPMILEDDKLAIQAAIRTLNGVDKNHVRMVYIKNTATLDTILVSEAFWEEARTRQDLEILENPRQLHFDGDGNLLDFA